MTASTLDTGRRQFLIQGTGAFIAVGVTATAVPFLAAWQPTDATRIGGRPVSIDLRKISEGEGIKFLWRGTPMWVVRRSAAAVADLDRQRDLLKDPDSSESEQPDYARNGTRARRADVLVLSAVCTHFGCLPALKAVDDAELEGLA